jgi:hypothetical protein
MQASARKMMRTKRELSLQVENHNRSNIEHLMKQQYDLANQFAGIVNQIVILQKNVLAILNSLKRRRIIDDFVISQELSAIEEMERMKSDAMIIGGKEDGRENRVEPSPGLVEKT